MEHWPIHLFMIAGILSLFWYLYMAYIGRSTSVASPSKIVAIGLLCLSFVGALIPMSQLGGADIAASDIFKSLYLALGLPGLAVGMSLFKVFIVKGGGFQ